MKKLIFLFCFTFGLAQNNGIRSLNGSLNNSQRLTIDTTSSATFRWGTSNGVHTLYLPYRIVIPSSSGSVGNADSLGGLPASAWFLRSDTVGLKSRLLKNADSTSFRTFSDSLYGRKANTNIWSASNYWTAPQYFTRSVNTDTIVSKTTSKGVLVKDSLYVDGTLYSSGTANINTVWVKGDSATSDGAIGNTFIGNSIVYPSPDPLSDAGIKNTAVGYGAQISSAGVENTTLGYLAGAGGLVRGNVAVGSLALSASPESYNTAVGHRAFSTSIGSNNIAIGAHSGLYGLDGDNHLYINSIDRTNADGDTSNSIIFGQQSNLSSDAQRLRFNSDVYIKHNLYLSNALDTAYTNAIATITSKTGLLIATRYNTKDFQLDLDTTGLRSKYVPYSGANASVNLGAQTLTTTGLFSGGAITATGLMTLGAGGTAQAHQISSNSANALTLYRPITSVGAASGLNFAGQTSNGTQVTYGTIQGLLQSASNSLQSGGLQFAVRKSGTEVKAMILDSLGNGGLQTQNTSTLTDTRWWIRSTGLTLYAFSVIPAASTTKQFAIDTVGNPRVVSAVTTAGAFGLLPVVDTVNYSAVASSIGSKNLTATAGTYRLSYNLFTRTAGTGGTAQMTLSFNNGNAQTMTSAAINLNSANSMDDDVFVYTVASGTPTVLVTVTGATGSPTYTFRANVERLQ